MDNKYGLGSSRVAKEHHDAVVRAAHKPALTCSACGYDQLSFCQTMQDHKCDQCGAWQNDVSPTYALGRSADY